MKKTLGFSLLALLVGGCTQQPTHVIVDNAVSVNVMNPQQLQPQDPAERSALGEPVGYLGGSVRQMAEQLETGLAKQGIKRLPIAITSFVDLSQADRQRTLGNEIAEGFFHELQARGFNLVDHRVIAFADRDEQELSLAEFYRRHRISYALGGSYIVNSDGVTVNARILDTVTNQVVATGQSDFGIDQLEGSLPGYDPFSSRDGMIIENGGVPAH
ncbi:MAG: FlgO family outer membrane protein [Motiliproteus sp.]